MYVIVKVDSKFLKRKEGTKELGQFEVEAVNDRLKLSCLSVSHS
jgi:hypothetical protein